MPIKYNIVDCDGIKLYRDDVVVDEFGDEWIVNYDDEHDIDLNSNLLDYKNMFYLKLRKAGFSLLSCIRSEFAATMKLKRIKWNG